MRTRQVISNQPALPKQQRYEHLQSPMNNEAKINKILNKQQGKKMDQATVKKTEKQESPTIKILKKQIRNIKQEVVKLIEEGFINTSAPSQWLQSSGNMSSLSKSSIFSGMKTSGMYAKPDSCLHRKDYQCNSFVVSYEQTIKLREQCDSLHAALLKKQRQQTELRQKYSQLQKQVNALRKCKQSLTQCIEILQSSLRKTNEQMKYYMKHVKKLQAQVQSCRNEKKRKENQYYAIFNLKQRLEEQIGYRKAENNQLIKIIQIKEFQVEQLKFNFQQQINQIQAQYQHTLEKLSLRPAKIYHNDQARKLESEIAGLRTQLQNRQKIMQMMLNDIRGMDKQLLKFDKEHEELLRCRELIMDLNDHILKFNMNASGFKYRYYF